MNLLKETRNVLKKNKKTWEDVEWIGCREFSIAKDSFTKLADVEYDSGYGSPEVATDLLIVGKDFYMDRREYDGSEWWEFNVIPEKKDEKTVFGLTSESLSGYTYSATLARYTFDYDAEREYCCEECANMGCPFNNKYVPEKDAMPDYDVLRSTNKCRGYAELKHE